MTGFGAKAKALAYLEARGPQAGDFGPEAFSVERLMHFATALEHDVVIEIRPRAKAAKGEDFDCRGVMKAA